MRFNFKFTIIGPLDFEGYSSQATYRWATNWRLSSRTPHQRAPPRACWTVAPRCLAWRWPWVWVSFCHGTAHWRPTDFWWRYLQSDVLQRVSTFQNMELFKTVLVNLLTISLLIGEIFQSFGIYSPCRLLATAPSFVFTVRSILPLFAVFIRSRLKRTIAGEVDKCNTVVSASMADSTWTNISEISKFWTSTKPFEYYRLN